MSRAALPSLRSSATCSSCVHFNDDPRHIESAFPGLAILSSAHAAVRSADGLCRLHDRSVSAGSGCARYRAP
jgi:hypothetical protein